MHKIRSNLIAIFILSILLLFIYQIQKNQENKQLYFQSEELGISFNYPAKLHLVIEHPASKKLKDGGEFLDLSKDIQPERLIPLQEWWQIDFAKERGFSAGYIQINAATSRGGPLIWEGSPHWLNAKIYKNESAEDVSRKLIKEKYDLVKIQKVSNLKNVTAFKAWVVNCYGSCSLDRIYIVPVDSNKYGSILIYSVLKGRIAGGWDNGPIPIDYDKLKLLAAEEINKIENSQSDSVVLKYASNQDIIFNSLELK